MGNETKKKKRPPIVMIEGKQFNRDPGFLDRLKEGFLSTKTKGQLEQARDIARRRAGKLKKKKPLK